MENLATLDNILFVDNGIFEMQGMELPMTFEREVREYGDDDEKFTYIYGIVGGKRIDLTDGIRPAIDHVNRNNATKGQNERYIVRDLTIKGVEERNGRYCVVFRWTDFVDCKRGYVGVECELRENKYRKELELDYKEPEFYF